MVPRVGLEALASWCGVIRTVVVAVVETPTPMLRQPTLAAPVVVVRVRDQGSPLLAAVQRTLAAAAVERGAVQAARRLALVAQESSSFATGSDPMPVYLSSSTGGTFTFTPLSSVIEIFKV